MDESAQQLQAYITQQLHSGQSPDEIAIQLRGANWPEAAIQQAFSAVQATVVPTQYLADNPVPGQQQTTTPLSALPQATDIRKRRIRTGWQLFKQSMTILRTNKYLLRYMLMTGAWVLGITLVLTVFGVIFYKLLFNPTVYNAPPRIWGYLFAFVDYLLVYFFINLYAAGLTANVLDLFQGNKKPYHAYMKIAWSKAPAILTFSLLSAIVGMFLRYVVERIRFVGWILAWILGTMWSLGTLFVVPIIVTSEHPSGVTAIKDSVKFFKKTWGQNITAKISVNGPLFLIDLALIAVFIFIIFPVASTGSIPLIIAVILLFWLMIIIVSIVGSFANSLVNIALFYFAAYGKVPPAFSEDLLNRVFIKRKRRRFFKKNKPEAAAA